MHFKYKKIAPQIIRPIIPIELISKDKRIRYEVLIDSGADSCIFHSEIGEILGLNVKKGKPGSVIGITGKIEVTYSHPVTLSIGGHDFAIDAYFKKIYPQTMD